MADPTTAPPRWIAYEHVRQLVPATRNPKGHDLDTLADSLARFGYLDPVVIDERTGRLVSGHGRTEALAIAEAAGLDAPEGITTDAMGAWLVPVVHGWRSANDTEAEAAIIALNRLVERGGWEGTTLVEMLTDLLNAGADLDGIGYTMAELDDVLASLGDQVVLPDGSTDAHHATATPRGEPAVPREVQGLREVGLMFQAEHHREYLELLAKLRRVYGEDAAPLVVLRAMRQAAEAQP